MSALVRLPVLVWIVVSIQIPLHDAFRVGTGGFGPSSDMTCRSFKQQTRRQSFDVSCRTRSSPCRISLQWTTTTTTTLYAQTQYQHALAILTMPETSLDRIANEAIIEAVLPETSKLSVVLRCQNGVVPSTAALRRYVGEVYSQLWDVALGADSKRLTQNADLPNAIVYPQNLPNAAPESWIDILPDLDCICSHDATIGWTSQGRGAAAMRFQNVYGNGVGGLDEHVQNVNRERAVRKLPPVKALHVDEFQRFVNEARAGQVVFLDDEVANAAATAAMSAIDGDSKESNNQTDGRESSRSDSRSSISSLLSGAAPVPAQHVYDSVCVGGTFDGLHFGHRKLLTLAVSSVTPVTGSLLVGVTVDEMLRKKAFYEYIPTFAERCDGVTQFLHRLAPGMINRIHVVPITDAFGPPGQDSPNNKFDAIVLSHETLHTGYLLNQHRVDELKLPPLQLLCTRRTEAHGMSSTALRRIRQQRQQQEQQILPQQPSNVVINL